MLKVECLGKLKNDNSPLFKDISFNIERGIVAVVGRSGSGKSTLLKCIAHLIPFEKGKVTLDNQPAKYYGYPFWRSNVCFVTQRVPALEGTPIELNNRIKQLNAQKSRHSISYEWDPINLCTSWGIDISLWNRQWHELSGGESQRILLAISISREPAVLLLDEPTSSLDYNSAIQVEKSLLKFSKNHGIVIVSHDSNQIERLDPISIIKIEDTE